MQLIILSCRHSFTYLSNTFPFHLCPLVKFLGAGTTANKSIPWTGMTVQIFTHKTCTTFKALKRPVKLRGTPRTDKLQGKAIRRHRVIVKEEAEGCHGWKHGPAFPYAEWHQKENLQKQVQSAAAPRLQSCKSAGPRGIF